MKKTALIVGVAHVISGTLATSSLIKQTKELKQHNTKLSLMAIATALVQTGFIIQRIRNTKEEI